MSSLTQIKPGALALASPAQFQTILANNKIKENQRDIMTSMNTLTANTTETLGQAAFTAANWAEQAGKDAGRWMQAGAAVTGAGTVGSVIAPAVAKGAEVGAFGKYENAKKWNNEINTANPNLAVGNRGAAGAAVPGFNDPNFKFTGPVPAVGDNNHPSRILPAEMDNVKARAREQKIEARKSADRYYSNIGTLTSGLTNATGRVLEGEGSVRKGTDDKEKEIQEGLKSTTDIAARSAESARQSANNAHDAAQQNAKEASETLRLLAQVSTPA